MRFVPLIFLFLLMAAGTTYGQDPYNFKFRTYTYNDGLVHNFTKKCLQDSRGFIWIITQHGLSRFDGVHFKNFEHSASDSNSLPQDDLEDIAIDNHDRIWLSYKRGLCYYDQELHRFIKVRWGAGNLESCSIVFDKKRNCIWSVNSTSYATIDCNDLKIQQLEYRIKQKTYEYIGKLLIDSKDRLWIPYTRLTYRCINLTDKSEYLHKERVEAMSFFEDSDKNIWMCTWQDGLREVITTASPHIHKLYGNPNIRIDNQYTFISTAISSSRLLGGKDLFWISLNTEGVLLFDRITKKVTGQLRYDPNNKNGIATDFNEWVFTDRDDNIWICTWHGITKANAREQQFSSRELPELRLELYNCVSGIIDDPFQKNIYWMAVVGSGIFKYDRNTKTITDRYYHYYNSATKSFKGEDLNYDWRWTTNLFKDSHNQLWSTTYAGLIKIKNGRPSQVTLKNKEGKITYPRDSRELLGSIWVATEQGIFKIDPLSDQYIYYRDMADPDNLFYDIELLNGNTLLLASDSGLKTFNISTGKFTSLPSSPKKVINIELTGNTIYLGGMNGFASYDMATHTVTQLGKEQGIEKVLHYRLRKDVENNLWIFTAHGLFKYYTSKGNFEKFTPSDGIYDLSDDAITFFSYQNRFYIGYRMAITSFDPLQVNVNTQKVTPVITEVYINNKLLSLSRLYLHENGLQLNHNENEIRINYTAPDFTNADKIIFSYQLQGFDTAWVNAGSRRTVAYTNLPPGHYTFRLKAANSSGLWNDKVSSYAFSIQTPFWQTWWFRISLAVLIAALIYALYRYRLQQVKKIYEVRSNISRSLHDEVGATLSSINIYSDVARKKNHDPAIESLIDKVYDASANAMENMSDIVWYVNPVNDLVENLLVRMREYALPLLEAKGINVTFDAQKNIEELKTTMPQRHNVYLIFKEAVNNALKYSQAKNIRISLEKENNHVKMIITDDGTGFPANREFSGNGIKNMHFRAKTISGHLSIESFEGTGTTIYLQFPIT